MSICPPECLDPPPASQPCPTGAISIFSPILLHLKNIADMGGNGIMLFEFAFPDDLRLRDTVLCIYSTIALPFL